MGQEQTQQTLRLRNFMGLNRKVTQSSAHPLESADGENMQITERSLQQRKGSTKESSNTFKEQTDTTAKPITGLYETVLSGTTYTMGVGGDAFKQFTSGSWTDKTGSVTITDDDDNLATFTTFWDGSSTNEIAIIATAQDSPIKWTGTGDAADLSSTPGDFTFQVVHKNRLWVAVGDVLYWSGLRDGESWDTTNDLVRFEGDGRDISGLAVYGDRLIVFKPGEIFAVSGSSNRDLLVQRIVSGDGCASGWSIQEVESRRYGNILIFLSSDGYLKGFNGSQTLIPLGEAVKPLWDQMNSARLQFATSVKYDARNQYWCTATLGSGATHNRVFVYDYYNDHLTNEETGKPLSSNLLFTGIHANALAIWGKATTPYLVTGDYAGELLRQDDGLLDEEANTIRAYWKSTELDFDVPHHNKILTDVHVSTTQTSITTLSVTVQTERAIAVGSVTISAGGGIWGTGLWGTMLWGSGTSRYVRVPLTRQSGEGALYGRFFVVTLSNEAENQTAQIEELIVNVSDLGDQAQYSGV